MTFSNCDHNASTAENSLPTCERQRLRLSPHVNSGLLFWIRRGLTVLSRLRGFSGFEAYLDDVFQTPVQFVDVGEDVLKALDAVVSAVAKRLSLSRPAAYRGDVQDERLALLFEVGLVPGALALSHCYFWDGGGRFADSGRWEVGGGGTKSGVLEAIKTHKTQDTQMDPVTSRTSNGV
ncbi:hypothetical protein UVI_02001670 [Ustilaginoidea virens]|uniref:Uncharacterized protein n=1 Tax=Ustilaginoidea virens TaxID=1159556 RepID=A0A1B5KTJ8_USTVR|nr:hypothetical protein UVI_02001670 [Ustilaginoidea virens]